MHPELVPLEQGFDSSRWLANHDLEPVVGAPACPKLAEKYGIRGKSYFTVFVEDKRKMGHMDAATKDVILSSLILSTTPPGTSDPIISVIATLCVSPPVGDRGKSKRIPLLSSCPSLPSFCIWDASFTHIFLAAINDTMLRLTCRTTSNAARD